MSKKIIITESQFTILKEQMSNKEINNRTKNINTNPTEAQKKAGNYSMAHVYFSGFKITIETAKGGKRYWVDDKGNKGYNVLKNHYGYFSRTLGHDGDHVDVFLGDNQDSSKIYVVDQNKKDGTFDESKVMLGFNSKKEAKEAVYEPVVFNANRNLTFEETISIFEKLTDKENQLSTSKDEQFFRLNKIFKLRTVLYRTKDFNKKDFDNAKEHINKKANEKLNISQGVSRTEAVKMMRFNIIFTDILNDTLYKFISKNANHNLTRVEGIINIAIVGNQIIIPPIYGECDLSEISRYKGVIKFINQVLLKN